MFSGKHNTTASASPLNQFQDICRKAVKTSLGRLHKSFNNILAEISLLMLLLPHKANFTQLEKYGKHSESFVVLVYNRFLFHNYTFSKDKDSTQ